MKMIDLNADLGEGCGDDPGLMTVISSANIACGGHAGDEASMCAALRLAKQHGVAAGAHPAYPDRENFGRRTIDIDPAVLGVSLGAQISALARIAEEEGLQLHHVKPHGALYNDAAVDDDLAREVVAAAARVLPEAAMVGLPGSKIMEAAEGAGLKFVAEGFADRAYTAAGQLVSRSKPGAVIEDEAARIAQALALAAGGPMTAITGEEISLKVQIICIHSDSPSALDSAKAIRTTLEQEGFTIGVPAS